MIILYVGENSEIIHALEKLMNPKNNPIWLYTAHYFKTTSYL